MRKSPPKPVVTTWDVFDTLVARFTPDPHSVFDTIEARQNAPGFVRRRVDAQAALDRVGQPYVLHDIYRQMVADGLPEADFGKLIRAEIAVETDLLFPIRRNVARVEPPDLFISDMYLSQETISAFLFEVCDLNAHRPVVRSNWGKHTGTIWPLLLESYVIRRHVGDNPHSDAKVPRGFNIACEQVTDSQPTAWEAKLRELGLGSIALVQREARLRSTPPNAGPFHAAVTGPYFTILVCFAIYLAQRFGDGADFIFLSRSADELSRVFTSMFPNIPARGLDISRRLAADPGISAMFAGAITESSIVVDMVGTGRSFFKFAEANGNPGRTLVLFAFLDLLLQPPQRQQAEQRQALGRFQHVCRVTGSGFGHWCLEHLLQSHYPPVARVTCDARSGGVVREFGDAELDQTEMGLVAWKSSAVTELVRTLRRRGIQIPGPVVAVAAMEHALRAIMTDGAIMTPFTSFRAREVLDEG